MPDENRLVSDDELIIIGKLTLNWAQAEFLLVSAVAIMFGISGDIATELIAVRDFKGLVSLLKRNKNRLPSEALPLVEELKYCEERFYPDRNAYAHGILASGDDGIRKIATARGVEHNLEKLEEALARSIYVAVLARHTLTWLFGKRPLDTLPHRPA